MAVVRDKSTGQTYEVSDVDAINAVRGNPNLEVVGDVNVSPQVRFSGQATAADPNARASTAGENFAYWKGVREEKEHDTVGSRVKSTIGGAIGTLDAGLWKPWEEDQSFHPGYATAGGIAALLPALATGEGEAAIVGDAIEGARAERAAAGAVELGEEAGGIGRSLKKAYDYTPPGIAAKIGRAAEGLVPETIAGSRRIANVVRTGIGGSAWAGSDELIHQALDQDADFSGENLLSAATYGGLLGAAGSAVSEGIGATGKLFSRGGREVEAVDEAAMRAAHPAETIGYSEPKTAFDLTKTPEGIKAVDAINAHQRDVEKLVNTSQEVLKTPQVLKAAGIDPGSLAPLINDAGKSVRGLEALKTGMAQPRSLTRYLNAADELGQALSKVTDSVPSRFIDPATRAQFWEKVGGIAKDISPEQQAAERVWAHLSSGMGSADSKAVRDGILASAGKALLGKGLLGRAANGIVQGGSFAATAAIVGEHIIEHGMHGLVHGALGTGAAAAGAAVAAKVIRAAFKDPAIGGVIAGSTVHVLRNSNVLPSDRVAHSEDPRRTLRDFADRTRRISPESAGQRAVASLSHVTGQAPVSVAKAGEVAMRRQAYVLQLLDKVYPQATPAQRVLGQPLPSAKAAGEVADSIRALASPANVVMAALDGRLTPAMVQAAEAVYPATVRRLRAALLSQLAGVRHPERLPVARRRTIEALLGTEALGGPGPSVAYRQAMRQSEMRAAQPTPQQPPKPQAQPSGPIGRSPLATPAQRAAHPGEDG